MEVRMDLFEMIPEDRHEDGGKVRLNVKHNSGSTPVLVTMAERERLRRRARKMRVSMSKVVRLAVRDLAERLDPNGHADIVGMAAQLGIPAETLHEIKADPAMRFQGDLSFLARQAGGVSLSRAARWAVNVYLDSENEGS